MLYKVTPRLGQILKQKGMTQTQLSELTGIPQGTISKFDRNRQHQDVHIVTILKILDLTIDELFEIEEMFEIKVELSEEDFIKHYGKVE